MIKDILSTNENIKSNKREMEILHRYFPQCFNKEGKFDIIKFQSLIKDDINITNEGYDLNFLGKSYAKLIASTDTTTIIKPDLEHNSKPENINSENIYISGDNLDGLKHLLKSYSNKIKCIYIDPPYNTGTDGFVYNDNFNFTQDELVERLSISEDEANKILDLTKRGSASHSAWLMFMASRLQLAKELLTDDGVIFISINDNEQANLKLLCDNIFGEENLIAMFCKKGTGGRQDSTHFAIIHEYILCYSQSKFSAGEEEKDQDTYPFIDSNGKKYKTQLLRKWGDASLRTDRPNMYFPIYYDGEKCSIENNLGNKSKIIFPMIDDKTEGRWRWGRDTMQDAIYKNLIEVKQVGETLVAYERKYESDDNSVQTKLYSTWIDDINSKTGKTLLKELFNGKSPFEYPKPLDLIKRIIKMGDVVDGIVLDFFSGSATTAHAIMDMNAEDGNNRKYIMVQWAEPCKENSVAYGMGFKTIDEIGQKRISAAADKIKKEYKGTNTDLGFKHYTLVEPTNTTIDKLERFDQNFLITEDNILNDFGKDSVLETWLVKDGYGFGAKTDKILLDKYTVYRIRKHLYLIDSIFQVDDMVALVDLYNHDQEFNPENIVLFGYSFNFSELEMIKKNISVLTNGIKNLKINLDIRY